MFHLLRTANDLVQSYFQIKGLEYRSIGSISGDFCILFCWISHLLIPNISAFNVSDQTEVAVRETTTILPTLMHGIQMFEVLGILNGHLLQIPRVKEACRSLLSSTLGRTTQLDPVSKEKQKCSLYFVFQSQRNKKSIPTCWSR